MEVSTELTIQGERTQLERLLARVEALLRDGWKRDRAAEERRGQHGTRGRWDYCFSCTATADRPAAGFWIHARSANELSISRGIALGDGALSDEEYHRLLAEFDRAFLQPARAGLDVAIEFSEHRPNLESGLSPEAIRLLRAFAATANRHGLQRPDRQRWNAFLVQVHRDDSLFDPARLNAWLEQEGWSEEMRAQLVGEYEQARSLLVAYDEEAEHR